jgi:hypothetical protein
VQRSIARDGGAAAAAVVAFRDARVFERMAVSVCRMDEAQTKVLAVEVAELRFVRAWAVSILSSGDTEGWERWWDSFWKRGVGGEEVTRESMVAAAREEEDRAAWRRASAVDSGAARYLAMQACSSAPVASPLAWEEWEEPV